MPTPPRLLDFERVKDLAPPFDGNHGWLSMVELNLIDPEANRFDIIESSEFVDGTVFVMVKKYSRCR